MPITVERDDVRRTIVVHATGTLSVGGAPSFLREHRTGEARSYSLLFDLRDVTEMPTGEELRAFARLLANLTLDGPRGRAAFVATTHAVYRAAQTLERFCEAGGVTTVRACRSLDEADAWFAGRLAQS